MPELLGEIFRNLVRHKLRTLLTGVSISWGVLMLVVLLGAGSGMVNGSLQVFGGNPGCIFVRGGHTAKPYQGLKPGRQIQLDNSDHELLRERLSVAQAIMPAYFQGGTAVSWGDRSGTFLLSMLVPTPPGLAPEREVLSGRDLSPLDLDEKRRVAVLDEEVWRQLFRGEAAVGQWIKVQGVPFPVVGVFRSKEKGNWGSPVVIPLATGQEVFRLRDKLTMIRVFLTREAANDSAAAANRVRALLAGKHRFDPQDLSAVFLWNNATEYGKVAMLMNGLTVFIWIIGVCTLIAGSVGVSNIMMIAVDERTREIGVRKALGATPRAITGMVMAESLLLSLVFGVAGLGLGAGIVAGIGKLAAKADFFKDPAVDGRMAALAIVTMAAAGIIASVVPARKAAAIKPIAALREE